MKTYKLKLTEEQFNLLTSKLNIYRNRVSGEYNNVNQNTGAAYMALAYYKAEIDQINELFDLINEQCKTKL